MFLNAIRLRTNCTKAGHEYFFVFDSIPDQYKTQEICDIVVSLYSSLIVYYSDKYLTQRMCDGVFTK